MFGLPFSILEILADIMTLNMQYVRIVEQEEGWSPLAQSAQIKCPKNK